MASTVVVSAQPMSVNVSLSRATGVVEKRQDLAPAGIPRKPVLSGKDLGCESDFPYTDYPMDQIPIDSAPSSDHLVAVVDRIPELIQLVDKLPG